MSLSKHTGHWCICLCMLFGIQLPAQIPTPSSVLGHTPGDDFCLANSEDAHGTYRYLFKALYLYDNPPVPLNRHPWHRQPPLPSLLLQRRPYKSRPQEDVAPEARNRKNNS